MRLCALSHLLVTIVLGALYADYLESLKVAEKDQINDLIVNDITTYRIRMNDDYLMPFIAFPPLSLPISVQKVESAKS